MAEIEITDSALIIRLKGMAKWAGRMNGLRTEIPLAHVLGAEINPEVLKQLGHHKKLERPDIEGVSTGTIEITLFKKEWTKRLWQWQRQVGAFQIEGSNEWLFSEAGNPENAIAIALTDETHAMLMLSVAESAETMARINAAVRRYRSS